MKLLRILSPHAELSRTSSTSAALTALFARLLLPAAALEGSSSSIGLGGWLSALANCQSPSGGGLKGLGPGDVLVGEAVGVCCIELARDRMPAFALCVSSLGGDAGWFNPPGIVVSAGVNRELLLGECCGAR